MSEAANIALNAIGMQDTHLLSKDPEKSFFNTSYKQPSEFRKYHNVHDVIEDGNIPTWPFGETVRVTLNPQSMGDLLTNLWINITIPKWTTGITFVTEEAEIYIFGTTLEASEYTSYDALWAAVYAAGNPGPGFPNSTFWQLGGFGDSSFEFFRDNGHGWQQYNVPGSLSSSSGEGVIIDAETDSWYWDLQLLGRKIIKSIRFIVDEQILEEITADWCIIHDNLYQTESQKTSANAVYNRNIVGASATETDAGYNNMYIHIPFFFSQNFGGDVYSNNKQNKIPFPLCAIHKQKIRLEIDFFKQSFFTNQKHSYNSGGDIGREPPVAPPVKKLKEFKIITEEITLSNEESLFFKNNNREIICDFVNKHSSIPLETNKRLFEVQLEPSIPVKCFHWFFRYRGYEDEDEYRHIESTDALPFIRAQNTSNRFNFTKAQQTMGNHITSPPNVLKNAYFSLNGERFPNISNIDHEYFLIYVPMQSQLSVSGKSPRSTPYSPPVQNYIFNNIYSYNFALFPKSTMPSGFLDFSGLNSEKTKLHFELVENLDILHGGNGSSVLPSLLVNPEYKFHMYYTGFKILRFNNGFVSIT
jgi:hypothetical protein